MNRTFTLHVCSTEQDAIVLAFQRAFTIMPKSLSRLNKESKEFFVYGLTDSPNLGPRRNVLEAWCSRNPLLETSRIYIQQPNKAVGGN